MNFEKYINSRWFIFFNFLYKIVVLSLIFFLMSLFGILIFTMIASGIAVITIIKSSNDNNELPLISSFWLIFKKCFLKSLIISLILFLIIFLFAFNTYYFYLLTKETKLLYSYIALYITIGLDIIALSTLIMIMLVSVYFPYLKILNTIKYSLMMLFAFPLAFFMLIGLIIVFFVMGFLFPYIIPMILPGLFLYFVFLIYDFRLMRLVSSDGILPLNAFQFLNEYRSKKKTKK